MLNPPAHAAMKAVTVPGVRYVPDYIDTEAHDRLLSAVDAQLEPIAPCRSVLVHKHVEEVCRDLELFL